MTKISALSSMMLLGVFLSVQGVIAQEREEEETSPADTLAKTVEQGAASKDSVSWIDTVWERICELVRPKREPVTRIFASREMEGLEFGEVKGPDAQEIRDAIKQLEAAEASYRIAIAQLGENVAEALYLIAQCHIQVGEREKALEICEQLQQEYPKSEWTKKAEQKIR